MLRYSLTQRSHPGGPAAKIIAPSKVLLAPSAESIAAYVDELRAQRSSSPIEPARFARAGSSSPGWPSTTPGVKWLGEPLRHANTLGELPCLRRTVEETTGVIAPITDRPPLPAARDAASDEWV